MEPLMCFCGSLMGTCAAVILITWWLARGFNEVERQPDHGCPSSDHGCPGCGSLSAKHRSKLCYREPSRN